MSKTVIRSELHQVLKGRKPSVHRPKDQKRQDQKLRQEIQNQLR